MTDKDLALIKSTAKLINAEYQKSKMSAVDSVNHYLKAGELLAGVKEELPHGEFIPWVNEYCDFNRQNASRMMKAFANVSPAIHLTEDDALAISRQMWGHNGSVVEQYTGESEWYTPVKYTDAVRDVLGRIDLDPASNNKANKVVQAKRIFTKRDNGLEQVWKGQVFLNPPYKQPEIKQFTEKLVADYLSGDVKSAILLTNNSTDTSWWQGAAKHASSICFTSGRISFYRDKAYNAPTNGQTFLYFGANKKKFIKEFADIGWIGVPIGG